MSNLIYENAVKVSGFYKDLSYSDQYGSSVLFVVVMIVILFFTYGYFKAKINAEPIRRDWANYRCNPLYIPYAGYIYKPDGKTELQYTGENFQYCLNQSLKPLGQQFMAPFDYLIQGLLRVFTIIRKSINSVREQIASARSRIQAILVDMYNRLSTITIPLLRVTLSTKDLLGKVKAILRIGLQSAMGFYITLKSLMGNIATGVAVVLIIGASVIVGLYGIFVVSFFFAPWIAAYALAQAVSYTILYIVMMVMLIILLNFMKNTLDVSPNLTINPPPKGPPAAPKCFDGNTEIELHNGIKQPIKSVKVGDVLYDGGMVTATFILDANNETMYLLNGVLVSGTHSVRRRDKWIKVYEHPDSIEQKQYKEPYLYCLNTTTKKIIIGRHMFIDWDEIFPVKEKALRERQKELGIVCDDLSFVHSHLDGGFDSNTKLMMHDGTWKYIEDIRPCDTLQKDIIVYGCVQIEKQHLNSHSLSISDNSKHLEQSSSTKLYHLLTNCGYFYMNEEKCGDYNHYVDDISET